MDEKNLNNKGFIKFCKMVKSELGEASMEVLYAWYFDTFDIKSLTKKLTTKTEDENENAKS